MEINYAMTEKELVSIVETFKYFRNIFLGYEIKVFTDHKNISYEAKKIVQCVQIWKSLIHQFGVTLLYIKGEAKVVTYAFIRIPIVHHTHK